MTYSIFEGLEQGMELEEKEEDKDDNHTRKLTGKS